MLTLRSRYNNFTLKLSLNLMLQLVTNQIAKRAISWIILQQSQLILNTGSNEFVLIMLDSSRHWFPNKRSLLDWGRVERSDRVKVFVTVASAEEMDLPSLSQRFCMVRNLVHNQMPWTMTWYLWFKVFAHDLWGQVATATLEKWPNRHIHPPC